VLPTIGCVTDDATSVERLSQQPISLAGTPIPAATGSFIGRYVVPAPSNLASAASFAVPEVEWTVASGVATLHYDLPVGLVGGDVSVTLTGPVVPGAASMQLTSGAGTGSCTAEGTVITCSEAFTSLGAMPVSSTVVQLTALRDHVSPASRMQVAGFFGTDPIGTVAFDISKISDDDDDDDDGGGHGGGGHGPH
jgi:hypothetical protein